MNYRLKYSNQLVFAFIAIALILISIFVVMIALKQKIFESRIEYRTQFSDASGLSTQAPLVYKGFEIGRVKRFILTDDGKINVAFSIYQKYKNIFVTNSVVHRMVNPLTGKTTIEFIKNPAPLELMPQNSLILSTDFPEGLNIFKEISYGKSYDPITSIITNLDNLIQEFGRDNNQDKGSIFRLLYNVANLTEQSKTIIEQVNSLVNQMLVFSKNLNTDNNAQTGSFFRLLYNTANLTDSIHTQLATLKDILANVNVAVKEYQKPDSLLIKLFDPTGDLFVFPLRQTILILNENLIQTKNLLEFMNREKPELGLMINNINTSLEKAQKTLEAINNNPLLRGGIPQERAPQSGTGARLRDFPDEK